LREFMAVAVKNRSGTPWNFYSAARRGIPLRLAPDPADLVEIRERGRAGRLMH